MVTVLIHFGFCISSGFLYLWIQEGLRDVYVCVFQHSQILKTYTFLLNLPLNAIYIFWDLGWGGRRQQLSTLCVCVNCSYCKRKLLMYNWRKKRSTQNKVCASLFCWSLSLWTMVVLVSIDFLPFNTEVQALKWWLFGFS